MEMRIVITIALFLVLFVVALFILAPSLSAFLGHISDMGFTPE